MLKVKNCLKIIAVLLPSVVHAQSRKVTPEQRKEVVEGFQNFASSAEGKQRHCIVADSLTLNPTMTCGLRVPSPPKANVVKGDEKANEKLVSELTLAPTVAPKKDVEIEEASEDKAHSGCLAEFPGTVGKGNVEIEVGSSLDYHIGVWHGEYLTTQVTFGITDWLDISLGGNPLVSEFDTKEHTQSSGAGNYMVGVSAARALGKTPFTLGGQIELEDNQGNYARRHGLVGGTSVSTSLSLGYDIPNSRDSVTATGWASVPIDEKDEKPAYGIGIGYSHYISDRLTAYFAVAENLTAYGTSTTIDGGLEYQFQKPLFNCDVTGKWGVSYTPIYENFTESDGVQTYVSLNFSPRK